MRRMYSRNPEHLERNHLACHLVLMASLGLALSMLAPSPATAAGADNMHLKTLLSGRSVANASVKD